MYKFSEYRQLKFSLLFSLVLLYSALHLQAADSLKAINNLRLHTHVSYGTILPHHSSIQYVLEQNIRSFELVLSTDSYGKNPWDAAFRYPRFGLSYLCTSLGNNDVFGYANAVSGFVDIPFVSSAQKFRLSYQLNFGMSYLTKVFDVNENPLNIAISSGFNLYASMRLNAGYIINENNELMLGFNLHHFSNGKMATPNLGLNAALFTLGYNHNLRSNILPRQQAETIHWEKSHAIETTLSGGFKTDDQVSLKYYPISSFVVDYRYYKSLRYSFGAGLDGFYDKSLGPNKFSDLGVAPTKADLYQLGFHGSAFIRYSRVNLVLQLGYYLHANYYKYFPVYTRIGFRFETNERVFLNLTLKSHLAIADYLEWGIGYRFKL